MKHPILRARAAMKMRGIDLPGWDDEVGMQVNLFWAEIIDRETYLEAAKMRFSMFMTFVMAGLPPHVGLVERGEALAPVFDDVLSKVDHSAYTQEKRVQDAAVRVGKARARIKEMAHMKWITSDAFRVTDWMDFKDAQHG